jgi:hypothetical protein
MIFKDCIIVKSVIERIISNNRVICAARSCEVLNPKKKGRSRYFVTRCTPRSNLGPSKKRAGETSSASSGRVPMG